ncbi:hypothetical protein ACFFOE_000142 [Klebsiella aerogenes]
MNNTTEKLRSQSIIALKENDYKHAIFLRKQVIDEGDANIGDYSMIGEWSLELNLYEQAVDMFTLCILLGKKKKNSWFEDSAYLLRAYAYLKLNMQEQFTDDLQHIEKNYNNASVTWLKNHPVINLSYLSC